MASTLPLRTARSSHNRCFICGRRATNYQRISNPSTKSIVDTFLRFNILIKNHARCCASHFRPNGLFKREAIQNIETNIFHYDTSLVKIVRILSHKEVPIFSTIELFQVNCAEK